MKRHLIQNAVLILAFICNSAISFSQTHFTDSLEIDSLRFIKTRKQMDVLAVDQFTSAHFSYKNISMPYRLLLPEVESKAIKYPLVITLHNSSRIGTDNQAQLENLAKIWLQENIRKDFPCFVLAPQFSERSSVYHENEEGLLISNPSTEVAELSKLIDLIVKQHPNIDQKRIYLIGYSMGGSTVQNLLRYQGKKIAAVVSIAAVPDFTVPDYLQNCPIWLIHGAMDTENPFAGSVALYKKFQQNPHMRFTEFTHLNHNNIVIPFLLNKQLPEWLFSWKK